MDVLAEQFDVVIIGAGAAGMMAAIEAGKRGRRVAVLDHAKAPGEKIRISGGGRCNFTNIHASPKNFLSVNPHFCKSALARYTPHDFIGLVDRYTIAWHEKTLGQLFCDDTAKDIIRMLLTEMKEVRAVLRLGAQIQTVDKTVSGFRVVTADGAIDCSSLIVASGGKSIPKMGATGLAYKIAEQFGLPLVETRPALVPLTLDPPTLERLKPLSGTAIDAVVSHGKTKFAEALLFTHRGLSGPAMLQISSFWREGDEISVAMLPEIDVFAALRAARTENGRQALQTALGAFLPKSLAQRIAENNPGPKNLADWPDKLFRTVEGAVNAWRFKPAGSEGYRTAEVTLGGVDTAELDSRSMQARNVPGLYFVGEVVDVTGWLGGYNFQWAWASGWSAGQAA